MCVGSAASGTGSSATLGGRSGRGSCALLSHLGGTNEVQPEKDRWRANSKLCVSSQTFIDYGSCLQKPMQQLCCDRHAAYCNMLRTLLVMFVLVEY